MRWIVEVSSVGKADRQSYCVESESWQRALQAARGIRDDHGPMTGYSIELLDEGFSAVDPMTRLRYFVKRTADETPLTSVPGGAPKSPSVIPPAMPAEARPATPAAPAPATAAPAKAKGRARTVVFGSTGAAVVAEAAAAQAQVAQAQVAQAQVAQAQVAQAQAAQAKEVAPQPQAAPAVQARHEVPRPTPSVAPPATSVPVPDSSPQSGGTVVSPSPVLAVAPAPAPEPVPTPPPPAPPAVVPDTRGSDPPTNRLPPSPVPTLPGIEVLYKREQDPDQNSPLTYREYVYFFPAAKDETMARAMLVAQFEMVRSSLEGVRAGKLVNLAMFDVSFKGRPPVAPVVTLTWKDWKGEPAIEFPRRKQQMPSSPPAHATSPLSSPAAALAPTSVSSAPVPWPTGHATQPSASAPVVAAVAAATAASARPSPPEAAPVRAPSQEPAGFPPPRVAAAAAPPPQVVQPQAIAPQPSVIVADNHVAEAAPQYIPQIAPQYIPQIAPQYVPQPSAPAPAPQAVPQAIAQAAPQQSAPAPQHIPQPAPLQAAPAPAPQASARRQQSKPTIRLRGDELIADLFEAMHDLHFLRDSVEGADFCLSLALEKIPSRAGIVHLYDIDRREFVVACVRGPNQESLLLRRYPEADPILSAAMRRQRAIVWGDASQTNGLERYVMLGGAQSLVVAPVQLSGRFLGAIELMDPTDGSPFSDQEGHALTYIGEQFAEFVGTRGVTVDPERIVASTRA
jgi:hypothetical protein